MNVLLNMTNGFIEMIDTDMAEKGRIRKKTLTDLLDSYIDYHLDKGDLTEPTTVIDCLITTVVCLGMALATARKMRKLDAYVHGSALTDITYHLRCALNAIVDCVEEETEEG